jgi:hypothetical protein
MNLRVAGIYREAEFSPGKESADRLIMDAVLDHLRAFDAETLTIEAASFISSPLPDVHLALAMCQSGPAINGLAALQQSGVLVINSALAIRNCYRDLLGPGLIAAGLPSPRGVVVRATEPIDRQVLSKLDLSTAIYIKRGDLHALGPQDVQRIEGGLKKIETAVTDFAARGIEVVYLQQEFAGKVVKFYGVGDGSDYFAVVPPPELSITDSMRRLLARAGGAAANALGLVVWGGDAVIEHENFSIVDFNDWPSFEPVRGVAAAAIARYALACLRRHHPAHSLFL